MRVTIAVGAALVVQTALALVWAGAAAERLSQLERRADASQEIIERVTRLEEQTGAMRASLVRIEAKLDRQNKDDLK
ncbi:MAG: hypothetical protein HXY23_09325 [Parvularculaceae bacterium]|nr:hypothetical protein [Parvularculaceae bacterium]